MDFLGMIQTYGPYIGLPVIIYYLTNYLKCNIPFFKTVNGLRLIHFIPMFLGIIGGFLLPEDSWQNSVLVGGALGCLNLMIYKTVTVTFKSKISLQRKIDAKPENNISED
jgi:hypothetical protein